MSETVRHSHVYRLWNSTIFLVLVVLEVLVEGVAQQGTHVVIDGDVLRFTESFDVVQDEVFREGATLDACQLWVTVDGIWLSEGK